MLESDEAFNRRAEALERGRANIRKGCLLAMLWVLLQLVRGDHGILDYARWDCRGQDLRYSKGHSATCWVVMLDYSEQKR